MGKLIKKFEKKRLLKLYERNKKEFEEVTGLNYDEYLDLSKLGKDEREEWRDNLKNKYYNEYKEKYPTPYLDILNELDKLNEFKQHWAPKDVPTHENIKELLKPNVGEIIAPVLILVKPKSETKPKPKSETKPKPKSETKPKPKSETKPKPKSEQEIDPSTLTLNSPFVTVTRPGEEVTINTPYYAWLNFDTNKYVISATENPGLTVKMENNPSIIVYDTDNKKWIVSDLEAQYLNDPLLYDANKKVTVSYLEHGDGHRYPKEIRVARLRTQPWPVDNKGKIIESREYRNTKYYNGKFSKTPGGIEFRSGDIFNIDNFNKYIITDIDNHYIYLTSLSPLYLDKNKKIKMKFNEFTDIVDELGEFILE